VPVVLLSLLLAAPDGGVREPLVEVVTRIPDAVVDLRYATADNFMGKAVYPPDARCLLLEPSLKRLEAAAKVLREQGFRLRLYDCYRPHHVQYELWKVLPKPGYVADPKTGSNHNRGGAIDLSLVRLDGGAVEMPSPYDFFGKAAHHAFDGGTPEARRNRQALRAAMTGAGFTINPMEWWHYDLPDAKRFPLRDEPFASAGPK
jgi:D-alanyl-D-alanine dipeptidase